MYTRNLKGPGYFMDNENLSEKTTDYQPEYADVRQFGVLLQQSQSH